VAVLKIARLWPSSKLRSSAAPAEPAGLDAFSSEAGSPVTPFPKAKPAPAGVQPATPSLRRVLTGVAIIVGVAAIGAGAYVAGKRPVLWAAAPGSVSFETTPAGVEVAVAGKSVGRTPLTLSLPAGTYDVRLGTGAISRTFSIAVTPRTSIVQHYEMPVAPVAPVAVVGSLRVETDPARQTVFLDGVNRGSSPLTLDGVSPGDHVIATGSERAAVKRTVHVTAGQSTSVILTAAAPPTDAAATTGGWLTVSAPIALQVKEGGRLIGSSDVERLMIPSGDHNLELANDSLGFRTQRTVKIAAGKTSALKLDVPNGTMSLNALPWADVLVDGEKVGQTPIGNLSRPIGRHEVVFRHPTLGERKESVVVTVQQPVRLGVDLRKK
jgi:PEGA domain-containing protein